MRSLLVTVVTMGATAGLAAVTVVTAAPGHAVASRPDTGQAARLAQGVIGLTIGSMSPQYARADSTIRVGGTISNGTGSAVAGLAVQLYSASAPIAARSSMDAFIGRTQTPFTVPEGALVPIPQTIPAGGSVSWHATFTAAQAQMASSGFGVYPVRAVLSGLAGNQIAEDRTLLPYWPGGQATVSPLKIAWDWPLIDQPHRQACLALTSNGLQPSLQQGGRLDSLLQAGASAAGQAAKLTWLIDPALLTDVKTMTSRYQTGGSPECEGAQGRPASAAAKNWLAALTKSVLTNTVNGQPVAITPYANVDMAALTHHGLSGDLQNAYTLGEKQARAVLGTDVMTNMSFPAGGIADQSVLTALAATEHASSVVLSSGEMPLRDSTGYREDALATVHTQAGIAMRVLVADSTITSVLRGASSQQPFAVAQRFLAETAMIASEVPESDRSVVISPPQTWAPSERLAQALLAETASVPWLRPVTLASLAGMRDAGGDPRSDPPGSKLSKRELNAAYLTRVAEQGARLGTFTSMLYQPDQGFLDGLTAALAACESSAWRGGGRAAGTALTDRLDEYLSNASGKVQILTSPGGAVQMAGSAGSVPVSIQNGLPHQAIKVRLQAAVISKPGAPNPLTVAEQKTVIVNPGDSKPVKLSLRSAPQGASDLKLTLVSASGTPTLTQPRKLTIDSTRYGRAILILIAAAIGLLLLTSVFRSGLRARKQESENEPVTADTYGADATGGSGG